MRSPMRLKEQPGPVSATSKECEAREKHADKGGDKGEKCQPPKDDCEAREKHADKGENCQPPKDDCERSDDGKHESGKWEEHAKNDCDDGPSKYCETEEPHCPPGDSDDCDVVATLSSLTAPDVVDYAIEHIDAGTFDMDYAELPRRI